jgi:hypothetical protein
MRLSRAVFSVLLMSAFPIFAAPRTYVASFGKDTNACTPEKPCRTFAAAIAVTDPNGEVTAIDSAEYGPFTLTSVGISVIAAPGAHASVTAKGSANAITVNGPTNGMIALRNLHVTSDGTGFSNGIVIESGGTFTVDHCWITVPATGIKVNPPTSAIVAIADTVVQQAYTGVFIDSPMTPMVTVNRCALTGVHFGVWVSQGDLVLRDTTVDYAAQTALTVAGVAVNPKVTVENCVFSHSPTGIYAALGVLSMRNSTVAKTFNGVAVDGGNVSIDSCIIGGNSGVGVQVYGDAVIGNSTISDNVTGVAVVSGAVRLTRNSIVRNVTGISVGSGFAYSTGDNMVDGNTTNVVGTITPATKM